MALDQAANFVRGTVDASISAGDTTISVTDASVFPDPSNGNYNLILWDAATYNRPGADPDVEIVRVTGRDTTNDDLTVTRGEESTADAAHPDTSILQLGWTAKMRDDIQANVRGTRIDDTDSPYTTQDEDVLLADTSSGAVTVTLATADVSKDAPLTVVNISGSNAVTVNTEGGETIDPDGDSSKTISNAGWSMSFVSDGSNWDRDGAAEFASVDAGSVSVTNSGARARPASDTTVTGGNASFTIPLGTVDYEDGNVTVDTANDKIVIDTAGRYLVIAAARYSTDGNSTAAVVGRLNGTAVLRDKDQPEPDNNQGVVEASNVLDCAATDEITATVTENTGSDQTLSSDASYTYLTVARLA